MILNIWERNVYNMSRKVAREVAFKIIFELAFQHDEEANKLFEN